MNVYTTFDELPKIPMAFTIGNFDGVHIGHQELLTKLRKTGFPTCVLTFREHPFQLLRPTHVPSVITPFPVKQSLFQTDFCLLLSFNSTLAFMTYTDLLDRLPLAALVLGKGALFGRNRLGTEPSVRTWGQTHDLHIEYIDKIPDVSSTRVRAAIQCGDFATAEKLLGRPHCLYAPSERFCAPHLTLPPDGTYRLSQGKATIRNPLIELSIPIEKPTILSFTKE